MKGNIMAKTYVRVDDRLIHGQTIVAWCPTLEVQEIIAVDDASASNAMLKNIMTMGVPSTYKTHIVTTDEAKKLLSADSAKNRLVIVKTADKLAELAEYLPKCEYVILGNLAKRKDTNHQIAGATGIFFLSDSDIAKIDKMVDDGAEIFFQQLPSTSKTEWDKFKKTL